MLVCLFKDGEGVSGCDGPVIKAIGTCLEDSVPPCSVTVSSFHFVHTPSSWHVSLHNKTWPALDRVIEDYS